MHEILESKGPIEVHQDRVLVRAMKGGFQEGWELQVAAFAAQLLISATGK